MRCLPERRSGRDDVSEGDGGAGSMEIGDMERGAELSQDSELK